MKTPFTLILCFTLTPDAATMPQAGLWNLPPEHTAPQDDSGKPKDLLSSRFCCCQRHLQLSPCALWTINPFISLLCWGTLAFRYQWSMFLVPAELTGPCTANMGRVWVTLKGDSVPASVQEGNWIYWAHIPRSGCRPCSPWASQTSPQNSESQEFLRLPTPLQLSLWCWYCRGCSWEFWP